MKKVLIIYFSGTGGTQRIAESIEKHMIENKINTAMFPLDLSKVESLSDVNDSINDVNRVIIAYPVYAFDAPKPIYRWIKTLPSIKGIKASVLSVSAGGDVSANRTARKRCIKKLEQKGFEVDYEKMITMPSNYAATAGENVNILLVKAVDITSKRVAEDIISGDECRNKNRNAVGAQVTAPLFGAFAPWFGKSLSSNENCTDCGWCEANCPTNNITMKDGKLKTAYKCAYCMRCVYGCPYNAIQSKIFGFSVVKDGFSIKEMAKKADEIDEVSLENIKKRKGWEGAYNYLHDVFDK